MSDDITPAVALAPGTERAQDPDPEPGEEGAELQGPPGWRTLPWPTIAWRGGLALIGLGILLLAFWAYLLWGTALVERSSQHRLSRQLEQEFASPAAAVPGVPFTWPALADGDAVARLQIPRIRVDQVVVEGTTLADLRRGPGHYPGTPLPGQPGNVAIAGHRTTYGRPFYDLNELSPGDQVLLSVPGHTWRYLVTSSMVVAPSDLAVAGPLAAPGGWLTLTTCNPRYSSATRLVVRARLASPAATAPANVDVVDRPAPPAAGASWWPLVGWAAAVAAAAGAGWLGARVARRRRLRWVVAGGAALLAVGLLWEAFGAAAALLPPGF